VDIKTVGGEKAPLEEFVRKFNDKDGAQIPAQD